VNIDLTNPNPGPVARRSLADCEAVIERGLGTFMEVGTALAEIRDQGLYRDTHGTFEAYCRERWGLSRKRAYDLMGATAAVAEVSPIGDTSVIVNEGQARALARAVQHLGPEVAAEVLGQAVAAADAEDQRLTARRIAEEAARRAAEAEQAKQRKQEAARRLAARDQAMRSEVLPRLLGDVILPRYGLTGVHDWCAILPWTTLRELASLAASIKVDGLLVPVVADPAGVLLDGKRRLLGCWLAGLPHVEVRTDTGAPLQVAIAENMQRRHLNEDQRAFLAVNMEAHWQEHPELWQRYHEAATAQERYAEDYLRRLESLRDAEAAR
jgi:hypothetical protein